MYYPIKQSFRECKRVLRLQFKAQLQQNCMNKYVLIDFDKSYDTLIKSASL